MSSARSTPAGWQPCLPGSRVCRMTTAGSLTSAIAMTETIEAAARRPGTNETAARPATFIARGFDAGARPALFPSTAKPHLASRSSVRVLPQSGAAVARVGSAEATFLAMPNGLHGKGSHTHNDKLSLLLHVGNDELLCDSGTGCYTRDASLRNRLRATSAHSTLSVAGQEQNRMDGRHLFCLGNDAVPTPITATVEDDSVMLSASHSGYVRIGIVHTAACNSPPASCSSPISGRRRRAWFPSGISDSDAAG